MTEARITQAGAGVVVAGEDPAARITSANAQVTWKNQEPPKARLTAFPVSVLLRHKAERVPRPPALFNAMYSEHRGIVNDPFYDKVELLLNADHYGLRDLSRKRRGIVISPSGGPGLDSGLSRFGQHSMRFCWLQQTLVYTAGFVCVDNSDRAFDFASDQFTVEAWIRVSNEPPSNKPIVGVWHESTNRRSWLLRLDNGSLQFLCSPDGVNVTTVPGTIVNFDVWNHVAVDRDKNGVVRLYLNGTMVGSATVNFPFFRTDRELFVGFAGYIEPDSKYVQEVSTGGFVGRMDDLRITRGWARYKTNGSFPLPEAAFAFTPIEEPDYYEDGDPHFDKVVLLIDAGVSTNLVDYSPNPTTITGTVGLHTYPMYGIPDYRAFSPKGTVIEMDGSGGRFNLNGPMTFEVFAHFPTSVSSSYTLLEVPEHFRIRLSRGSSAVQVYKSGAWVTIASPSSGWEHQRCFELSRDENGTLRVYFNGWFLTKIENDVWDEPAANAPLLFNTDLTNGYTCFSKVRITKGVARWTHEDSYAADMEFYRPWPRQLATPPSYNPTYPGSLEVYNAGAEQPSTLMWEAATGTKPSIVPDTEVTPHSGDHVYDSGSGRFNWYYQTLDIPSDYWGDIDAGHVQLIAKGWAKGDLTGDDWGALYVAAVGKSRADVRYMHVTPVDDPSDWTEISHSFRLPKGTRRVRIGVQAHSDPDNETLQLYWDDFSLGLEFDDEVEVAFLDHERGVNHVAWSPSVGSDLVQLTTNFGTATVGVTESLGVYGYNLLLPKELYSDIDDSETDLTLVLDYHLIGRPALETGRLFIDVKDAEGTTLGRIYDAETPYAVHPCGESRTLEVKLPDGARRLVIGVFALRDGEDGFGSHPVTFMSARLEYRDSEATLGAVDIELPKGDRTIALDFDNQIIPDLILKGLNHRDDAWVVYDPDPDNGSYYSFRFPRITHNQSASIDLPVYATEEHYKFKVRYRTHSETVDRFRVYVDDIQVFQASGLQTSYSEFTYELPLGPHTVRLAYEKDASVNTGDDTVYISRIEIPVRGEIVRYRVLEDGTIRTVASNKPRLMEG